MTLSIKIPKEFEEHFNNDRFNDSLKRIFVDLDCSEVILSGLYEQELIEMLQIAMSEAEIIKDNWHDDN